MLYLHEAMTQKEIAAQVGVSEVSLCKWIRQEGWESLRVSITITREEQLKNLYRQLAAINETINEKEEGKRFASTAEADTISKLANAIEKMETEAGVAEIYAVSRKFLSWLRQFDVKQAQTIAPLFNSFIKQQLK